MKILLYVLILLGGLYGPANAATQSAELGRSQGWSTQAIASGDSYGCFIVASEDRDGANFSYFITSDGMIGIGLSNDKWEIDGNSTGKIIATIDGKKTYDGVAFASSKKSVLSSFASATLGSQFLLDMSKGKVLDVSTKNYHYKTSLRGAIGVLPAYAKCLDALDKSFETDNKEKSPF